jgi:hypothetical protein
MELNLFDKILYHIFKSYSDKIYKKLVLWMDLIG